MSPPETATNPASPFGPVAEQEFAGTAEHHKADLANWLTILPGLDPQNFLTWAARAIHDSAQVSSWRGNWEHEHCKATAAYADANRRHREAGHTEDCTGDTLYSRAFARAWRDAGHRPSAYPPRPCDCGAGVSDARP
jgi:hypothetical protein